MEVALYRYGNIQPSEVDRWTIERAQTVLDGLKHLIAQEEKARLDVQQDLIAQAAMKNKM